MPSTRSLPGGGGCGAAHSDTTASRRSEHRRRYTTRVITCGAFTRSEGAWAPTCGWHGPWAVGTHPRIEPRPAAEGSHLTIPNKYRTLISTIRAGECLPREKRRAAQARESDAREGVPPARSVTGIVDTPGHRPCAGGVRSEESVAMSASSVEGIAPRERELVRLFRVAWFLSPAQLSALADYLESHVAARLSPPARRPASARYRSPRSRDRTLPVG